MCTEVRAMIKKSFTCACVRGWGAGYGPAGSPPAPSSCRCSSPGPARGKREGEHEALTLHHTTSRSQTGKEEIKCECYSWQCLQNMNFRPVRGLRLFPASLMALFLSRLQSIDANSLMSAEISYRWPNSCEYLLQTLSACSPRGCLPWWCSCRRRPVRLQRCAESRSHRHHGRSCSARSSWRSACRL